MITFGYNKRFTSIIRAIIAVAMGITLILFRKDGAETIVQLIGIGILFAGVISLIPMLSSGNKVEKENRFAAAVGWTICGIASLLGLIVVLKPIWFVNLFIFLVAAAIIIFCTIQLIALISTISLIGFTPLPIVLTGVSLIGAITVMFFAPGKVICIVTGILLIVYGVAEILSLLRVRKAEEIYIQRSGPVVDAEPTALIPNDSAGDR